jgi:8-oxo-dGTP diphosphatase
MTIPYKIAVLVYVYNDDNKMLLLHRRRHPNRDLYSPIGGKLEQALGESPYACALREIEEEIGATLTLDDIRLVGIVSEKAFAGGGAEGQSDATHWLMFCFEVTRRLNFPAREIPEGRLEWIDPIILPDLPIPRTDRDIIWPLVQSHSVMLHPHVRRQEAFFSVHIDCTAPEQFVVTHEHPRA